MQKEGILKKKESVTERRARKDSGASQRKEKREKISKEVSDMGIFKELKKKK